MENPLRNYILLYTSGPEAFWRSRAPNAENRSNSSSSSRSANLLPKWEQILQERQREIHRRLQSPKALLAILSRLSLGRVTCTVKFDGLEVGCLQTLPRVALDDLCSRRCLSIGQFNEFAFSCLIPAENCSVSMPEFGWKLQMTANDCKRITNASKRLQTLSNHLQATPNSRARDAQTRCKQLHFISRTKSSASLLSGRLQFGTFVRNHSNTCHRLLELGFKLNTFELNTFELSSSAETDTEPIAKWKEIRKVFCFFRASCSHKLVAGVWLQALWTLCQTANFIEFRTRQRQS